MPETKNIFSDYFQLRIETFQLHLNNTRKNYDVESLHQLRVEIKKLRAYLNLLAYGEKQQSSEKEYRKQLSRVFKPGGKLRETQINKSILEAHTAVSLPKYYEELLKKEQKQTAKFKVVFENFDEEELLKANEMFLESTRQIGVDDFEDLTAGFLKQNFEEVKTLMPKLADDEILHDIRRHLKVIGYVFQLSFDVAPDPSLEAFYLQIKEIETMIGNWHDQIVFVSHIEKFLIKHAAFDESEQLSDFKQQLISEVGKMVEDIVARLELLFAHDYFRKSQSMTFGKD